MKNTLTFLICLFFFGILTSCTESGGNSATLECTISPLKTKYRLGDIPEFQVKIVNKSTETMSLIKCKHGAEFGKDYPKIYFDVSNSGQKFMASNTCKYTGTLELKDFVEVAPDAAFNPFKTGGTFSPQLIEGHPTAETFTQIKTPGKYTFQFIYDSGSKEIEDYLGALGMGAGPEMKEKFKKLTHLKLKSNKVEVEFDGTWDPLRLTELPQDLKVTSKTVALDEENSTGIEHCDEVKGYFNTLNSCVIKHGNTKIIREFASVYGEAGKLVEFRVFEKGEPQVFEGDAVKEGADMVDLFDLDTQSAISLMIESGQIVDGEDTVKISMNWPDLKMLLVKGDEYKSNPLEEGRLVVYGY